MTARRSAALVAACVVVLSVPYLVAGPNFHADDWVFVRNARFDGVLGAAGPRQVGRPGAALVYDLTFGAIGPHPLTIQFVQVALWIAAAIAVLFALREFFAPTTALIVTVVWVVVPTHSTLEHWASTTQALLALTLLASGVCLLARAVDQGTRGWLGLVLLAGAVACYEVTTAAALAALVVVPLARLRRIDAGMLVRGTIVIAAPLVWLATHRTVYPVARGPLDASLVLPGNLSLGLTPYELAGRIVTGIALFGALLAVARLARPSLRGTSITFEVLAASGLGLMVVGVLPLVPFATNFIGMDDRLTLVSGIGAAMVWTGVVAMAARDLNRPALVLVGAVVLVAIAVPVRIARTRDFVDSGQQAVAETSRLTALVQQERVVHVGGPLAVVHRVYGLNDGWNTTAAVQHESGRDDVVVLVDINGEATGPPPDQPMVEFR